MSTCRGAARAPAVWLTRRLPPLQHEDAENIGWIIPTTVIHHFLSDVASNGSYTGFPSLGIEWQKMENPDLRKYSSMGANQKGVLVRRVEPTCPASRKLKKADIILEFDGHQISNDGTVPFRSGERISFSYLVSNLFVGDRARLKVLRGGAVKSVTVELSKSRRLVPVHLKGAPPQYFIFAGLIFTQVCVPYLKSEYGKDYDYDAPVKLLDKMLHGMPAEEGEQVVVLAQVLAAEINLGYEEIVNTTVLAMNGEKVKSVGHLASLLESCEEKYVVLDLEYKSTVVLDTAKAKAATEQILKTHCIPAEMSDGVKALLPKQA